MLLFLISFIFSSSCFAANGYQNIGDGQTMVGATSSTNGASGLVPAPSAGQQALCLSGAGTYVSCTGGSGTVSSVSVVTANGLAGTVANATTTPAITLSTSLNAPIIAGNGSSFISATTTGSGSTVPLSISPTFTTSVIDPLLIGGSGASSSLSLQSTSATGSSDFINFLVGNNGATEAMRILDSGKVGIGTTNPYKNLEIDASGSTGANGPAISFYEPNGYAGVRRFTIQNNYTVGYNYLTFNVENDTGGLVSSAVAITSAGNVGIGTTSPSSIFDVHGGAIVSDGQASSTQCVNFGTGNVQVSSYSATNTINVGGMVDGGAYTLILTGYTAGQTVTINGYTDTACSNLVYTGVDFGGSTSAVTSTFTAVGNTQLITLIYSNSRGVVYASAATNFYH